jgi:TetR/AcrR family transcriptional regulator
MKTRIQLRNEERILDAAQEVFATYGYHGATIDEVADRAGISKPNLHYYFKRKRDLYLAVLRRTLEIWLVPLGELDRTGDPAAEIGNYIAQKVQLSRRFPAASRVFANEIVQGAPFLKGYAESGRAQGGRDPALDRRGKAGTDRPVSPDLPDLGSDAALRGLHSADQGGHERVPAEPGPFPQG